MKGAWCTVRATYLFCISHIAASEATAPPRECPVKIIRRLFSPIQFDRSLMNLPSKVQTANHLR